jgi:hypothetical protein
LIALKDVLRASCTVREFSATLIADELLYAWREPARQSGFSGVLAIAIAAQEPDKSSRVSAW